MLRHTAAAVQPIPHAGLHEVVWSLLHQYDSPAPAGTAASHKHYVTRPAALA